MPKMSFFVVEVLMLSFEVILVWLKLVCICENKILVSSGRILFSYF